MTLHLFVVMINMVNTIRELYKILIEDNNGIITFTIVGNGFRRYMVRHIVGGLIQVGAKRITKKDYKNF